MSGFDIARSDSLHERVRNFIHTSMRGLPSEPFDRLALDIAAHQVACCTGVERLLASRNRSLKDLHAADDIPAVPTDVFKLRRVACHPAHLDQAEFLTSGTTLGTRGSHPFRSTATYRAGARAWGCHMLLPDTTTLHWILLAAPFRDADSSSLGFMLDDFARAFGDQPTWGLRNEELDLFSITSAIDQASKRGVPVIVAGASFAFVHLLDRLGGKVLPLGPRGRVMQTGGFKGRSREVDAATLRREIASTFAVSETHVVAEYGMTELSSQAYEGTLRCALGFPDASPHSDVLQPPPWMRIIPVDPVSLAPVNDGEIGIARIEDLANVDSAVVVLTADRVMAVEGGTRLLGRTSDAVPRGCSIGVDEVLGGTEMP